MSRRGARGTVILHGYWRSGTSYRVRIALALKNVAYRHASVNLLAGEQREEPYRALNSQALVPALETEDGAVLTQSPAIMEWLEERFPDPPLLPPAPDDRARVRAMAALVACDIHPLGNLRVLNALRSEFAADAEAVKRWIARWITDGFTALERMVAQHGQGFAWGDRPTLADCHLVPQLYAAERFEVDLESFPHIVAAGEAARALPAFRAAHPDRQPDAPAA